MMSVQSELREFLLEKGVSDVGFFADEATSRLRRLRASIRTAGIIRADIPIKKPPALRASAV